MSRTDGLLSELDRFSPRAPKSRECHHREREFLGSDSGLMFSRCAACGALCVFQEGRMWVVPPVRPS